MKERLRFDENEYRQLLKTHLPRPIRSPSDQDEAERMVTTLLRKPQRSAAENQILELVSQLLEIWEDRHEQIPDVHGVQLVELLLRERGQTPSALNVVFGSSAEVTTLLTGHRQLEPDDCVALGNFFGIAASAFLPA